MVLGAALGEHRHNVLDPAAADVGDVGLDVCACGTGARRAADALLDPRRQPRQIEVGEVRELSSGFAIDGTANKGADGIKKLRCLFTAGRTFDQIMAMTPDGE